MLGTREGKVGIWHDGAACIPCRCQPTSHGGGGGGRAWGSQAGTGEVEGSCVGLDPLFLIFESWARLIETSDLCALEIFVSHQ